VSESETQGKSPEEQEETAPAPSGIRAAEKLAEGVQAAAEALLEPNDPEPIPTSAEGEAEDPELEDVEAATIDQPSDDEEVDASFDKLAAKARRLSPERCRTILEALLFVCDKPLSEDALRQATGLEVDQLREHLGKLQGHYRDGVRGIVLHEVAGGWQFRTDAGAAEYVRRFLKVKPQRLTRAALETLAIIAYRQPVTRPEIEDIRAVDSGAVLKALLERHLVKIIGKRDEPGRPLLYGTTKEFLEFFNLRDLGSLPTLREFQELTDESRAVVEKETGEPAPALQTTENLVSELRDDSFEQKLSESNAEADDALAELETALADSEQKTKEAVRTLNPQQPPADPSTPPVSPAEADDSPDET